MAVGSIAFDTIKTPFGEVTDIVIDPSGTSDQTIYITTDDGGIWKTTDAGSSWRPLTDQMFSISMGLRIPGPQRRGNPLGRLDCSARVLLRKERRIAPASSRT